MMRNSPYLTECTAAVQPGESIQAAIDGAQDGATICLSAGIWEENLKIENSLTLRGVGQEKTVIKGKEEGYPVVWIISTEEVAVQVEGLTIVGAHGGCADWHRGICANGLLVQGLAKVKIIDSAIFENRKSGLFLGGEAQVEIIDSVISRNGHYGLWLMGSAQVKISGSIISRNGFGPADGLDSARDGIALRNSAQAEIKGSIISKNGDHGLWLADSSQAEIGGSTISENRQGGIWLRDRAQARIAGNRIIDNGGYGIALFQRPCYTTSRAFLGHIAGRANTITGRREAEGKGQRAVCPPELEFLMTEEGREYPQSQHER